MHKKEDLGNTIASDKTKVMTNWELKKKSYYYNQYDFLKLIIDINETHLHVHVSFILNISGSWERASLSKQVQRETNQCSVKRNGWEIVNNQR